MPCSQCSIPSHKHTLKQSRDPLEALCQDILFLNGGYTSCIFLRNQEMLLYKCNTGCNSTRAWYQPKYTSMTEIQLTENN